MNHEATRLSTAGKQMMLSVFTELRRMPGWNLMDRQDQIAAVARIKKQIHTIFSHVEPVAAGERVNLRGCGEQMQLEGM